MFGRLPSSVEGMARRRNEVLFDPVLREQGATRLVYSTPIAFRIGFVVVAVVIVLCIAAVPEGPFLARFNAVSLTIIGVCLFAALYLERWTFDKGANRFERNVGILPVYWRKQRPLDSLRKVVLRERGVTQSERPSLFRVTARGAAVLYVVDQDDRAFRLDLARGSSARLARKYAEMLAAFCAIPLEEAGPSGSRADDGDEGSVDG